MLHQRSIFLKNCVKKKMNSSRSRNTQMPLSIEVLRINPKDAKSYSKRVACYAKLGAMLESLKDAEKCIEIDFSFLKGYTIKGAIQFFMKEFNKDLPRGIET